MSAVSSAVSPLFVSSTFFWSSLSLSLLFISLVHSSVAHYFPHVAMLQKEIATPFVVAPFCGAPIRPNMLNMPKSAAEKG